MRYVTKEFLNDSPEEFGSICCTITTTQVKDMDMWNTRNGGHIAGEIRIADCSKHVQLCLYAEGQKNVDKRLAKLDKLIDALTAMRHQYVHMWENHQRNIEFYNKSKGENK